MRSLVCRFRGHDWSRWARVDFGADAVQATPRPEVRYCKRCIRFQANVTAALTWRFLPVLDGMP